MKLDVQLNKTYDYFDDGKIRESRRHAVTITEIIPYSDIDEETLSLWKEEVKECYWLYAKNTDYFIKGRLDIGDNTYKNIVFVRTINNENGWFSMGWWSGQLDVDGELFNSLK